MKRKTNKMPALNDRHYDIEGAIVSVLLPKKRGGAIGVFVNGICFLINSDNVAINADRRKDVAKLLKRSKVKSVTR